MKDKIQELELFTFCYEDEMESFAFHSSRSNEYVASALQDDFPLSKALRY